MAGLEKRRCLDSTVHREPEDRLDPYKNFKFRVKWDGHYVAGISKVSALRRMTEVIEHREGGDPSTVHKSPGQTRYEPITLERGVTHDTDFEKRANKVWNYGSLRGAKASLADFRKDITIELYNEAGQLVLAYKFLAAGFRSIKPFQSWMPTKTLWLSKPLS
jgi:phage tail-like protein